MSHAQIVTAPSTPSNPRRFEVLEVGWTIRLAWMDELNREFLVYRPTIGSQSMSKWQGTQIATDTVKYLTWAGVLPKSRYPWWKLPIYLFPRDWQEELLRKGPRQVCSVTSCKVAVSHGVKLWVGQELIDQPEEIRTITPADLCRNAIRQEWELVMRTYNAPDLHRWYDGES